MTIIIICVPLFFTTFVCIAATTAHAVHHDVQNDIRRNNMTALPINGFCFVFLPGAVPLNANAVFCEADKCQNKITVTILKMPG